ncbi:hypothetical protein C6V04_16160, partial [Burkholderia multivorans]
MLAPLHLEAIVFAYNEGYSKAYDGRSFPNPFAESGSQAAAWVLGTRDGNEARVKSEQPPAQADALAEAREPHSDDVAVDSFAAVMKHKLALAREKGRGGWETCSPADLSRMLREHVEKGDPRDVANFCMMLWHHGSLIVGAAGDAEEAAPFGWAQPKGGNHFTRNESSAKRIGGLVPVYAAPQPAQADAPAVTHPPAKIDTKARMDWAEGILRKLPSLDPTYSIVAILNDYDPEDRDELLHSIRTFADMRATQALFTLYAAPADARVAQAGARVGLTDEQIDEIARPFAGLGGIEDYRAFARALLAPTQQPSG